MKSLNNLILNEVDFNDFDKNNIHPNTKIFTDNDAKIANKGKVKNKYFDDGCIKWMGVKKRDYYTLASAFLNGLLDNYLIVEPNHNKKYFDYILQQNKKKFDQFLNPKSKEELLKFLKNIETFGWLGNGNALDAFNKCYDGYKKFFNSNKIKVYRGIKLTSSQIKKIYSSNKKSIYSDEYWIQLFSNENKLYNHWATNISNAMIYCKGKNWILFEAEAEKNDISFAATFYNIGKNAQNINELIINNNKRLKNFKIYDKELEDKNMLENQIIDYINYLLDE